ncbi:hypothetical protein AMECASPLE_017848 [Ameca splendens]|uniref:Uncharacterized protein n=1 Tax=Ameca splendens TaxID=208324 RepID=A0ABV0Z246_9TELE
MPAALSAQSSTCCSSFMYRCTPSCVLKVLTSFLSLLVCRQRSICSILAVILLLEVFITGSHYGTVVPSGLSSFHYTAPLLATLGECLKISIYCQNELRSFHESMQ